LTPTDAKSHSDLKSVGEIPCSFREQRIFIPGTGNFSPEQGIEQRIASWPAKNDGGGSRRLGAAFLAVALLFRQRQTGRAGDVWRRMRTGALW
jgi:hypothetical protein